MNPSIGIQYSKCKTTDCYDCSLPINEEIVPLIIEAECNYESRMGMEAMSEEYMNTLENFNNIHAFLRTMVTLTGQLLQLNCPPGLSATGRRDGGMDTECMGRGEKEAQHRLLSLWSGGSGIIRSRICAGFSYREHPKIRSYAYGIHFESGRRVPYPLNGGRDRRRPMQGA